ncbi:MAG: hypothetical protein OXC07_02280 [Kistimonas sp.]|nr:hypothetical protein [Kistimonas sp.]
MIRTDDQQQLCRELCLSCGTQKMGSQMRQREPDRVLPGEQKQAARPDFYLRFLLADSQGLARQCRAGRHLSGEPDSCPARPE